MGFLVWAHLVVAVAAVADTSAPAQAKASQQIKPHEVSALQRSTLSQREPHDEVHRTFLNKQQLKPIDSIACLQEKQRHPDRPCSEKDKSAEKFTGALNIGHFPHWEDTVCNSNFEYFCDPSKMLTPKEERTAQERLQQFRERVMVNCGRFEHHDDHTQSHDPHSADWYDDKSGNHIGRLGLQKFRPFNLGVIVVDEWPSNEMDPKSIHYFGRVIMAQWGLQPLYNGVDNDYSVSTDFEAGEYFESCPNAAVLFILPRYRKAYVASPSCEYICPSRGGPEVVAAVEAGFARGGLQEAILSGIDQMTKVLELTTAMSNQEFKLADRWRGHNHAGDEGLAYSDKAWTWAVRVAYVGTIIAGVIFTSAFVYYVLLPDKVTGRVYRPTFWDMTGDAGRMDIQDILQSQRGQ